MTEIGHCCACDTRQAFLDGYRHGLGAAVAALDATRQHITREVTDEALTAALSPQCGPPPHSPRDAIGGALHRIAHNLRLLSASITLADRPER